jgi:hypothetical protein
MVTELAAKRLRMVPVPKSNCPPTQHLLQTQTPAPAF